MSIPIIENAPIDYLPGYMGGYQSCKVRYYHKSNMANWRKVTIESEEAQFIRNLYVRYQDGFDIPLSWSKSDLVQRVLRLENKGLISRKGNLIFLTQPAREGEYTLIPR